MAFVEGEDGLAVGAEEHEVGLPAGGLAVRGEGGAVDEGAAVGDTGGGAAALAPPPAPFELGPGQIVAPGIVLRAADLGVNEAVDGFVGDDGPPGLAGQAPGHLRGRPALLEAGEDLAAQRGIAVEPGPAPHCVSTLEQSSMARDPDLPRFGGSRCRRRGVGPRHSGLQWRDVHSVVPWQHPKEVLHFLCESREALNNRRL